MLFRTEASLFYEFSGRCEDDGLRCTIWNISTAALEGITGPVPNASPSGRWVWRWMQRRSFGGVTFEEPRKSEISEEAASFF